MKKLIALITLAMATTVFAADNVKVPAKADKPVAAKAKVEKKAVAKKAEKKTTVKADAKKAAAK